MRSHIGWVGALSLLLAACGKPELVPGAGGGERLDVVWPDLSGLAEEARSDIEATRALLGQEESDSERAATLWGRLGMLALANDLPQPAQAALTHARQLAPDSVRWCRLLALAQLQLAAPETERVTLESCHAIDQDDLAVRMALAEARLREGSPSEALQLAPDPSESPDAAAWAWLRGRAQIQLGDSASAAQWLSLAARALNQPSRVHYTLAQTLRTLGRDEEARTAAAQVGAAVPAVTDPHVAAMQRFRNGAVYADERGIASLSAGHASAAEAWFRKALAIRPEARLHQNLAVALRAQNRLDEALQELERGLQLAPTDPALHFSAGTVLAHLGRDAEAVPHYESALTVNEADANTLFNLANARRRLGEGDAALQGFERATALDPGSPRFAYAELAQRVALRQWERASARAETLARQFPNELAIQVARIQLLAACPEAQWRNGREAQRLAARLFSQNRSLEAGRALAMALAETGAYSEASTLMDQLLQETRGRIGREDFESMQIERAAYRDAKPWRLP